MFGLIIFVLLVIAITYGLFFLIFKGIWLLCKKHKNLWPLVLAGISTIVTMLALAALTAWGVMLILAPFLPMKQRWEEHPQPIYGLHAYTDPAYHFTLQLPDGMDYSEWIDFDGYSVKLGFNTNLVKKDQAGKGITGPLLFSLIIRQSKQVNPASPFSVLEKELLTQESQRRLTLQEHREIDINGYPGYYASGISHTNRGNVPLWLQAVYQNGVIVYVVSSEINNGNASSTSDARTLATSLQPALAPLLTESAGN